MMNHKQFFWDNVWISLAKMISQKSNDPRLKVAAVIVSMDNESVLSFGYNRAMRSGRFKQTR